MQVVSAENIDFSDPHGYYQPADDTQVKFRVPWKRTNLSVAIRELHIMKKARIIPPSTNGYFHKQRICKLIDQILEIQRPKPNRADRVKRLLFKRNRKNNARKPAITRKNTQNVSSAFKFRSIRQKIGFQKIKKNYLDEARVIVQEQVRKENLEKRRPSSTSTESGEPPEAECTAGQKGMFHIKTEDGIFPISPDKLSEICKFHEKMVRQHPAKKRTEYEQFKRNLNTEACRLSRRVSKLAGLILMEQYKQRVKTNAQVVEQSVRLAQYLKAISNLLTEAQRE